MLGGWEQKPSFYMLCKKQKTLERYILQCVIRILENKQAKYNWLYFHYLLSIRVYAIYFILLHKKQMTASPQIDIVNFYIDKSDAKPEERIPYVNPYA